MKILFLHGWTSTPGGRKPTYLKDHGHEILNPALPDEDFDEAVRIAQAEFDQHQPDVVVGSSRGGAVAVISYFSSDPSLAASHVAIKNVAIVPAKFTASSACLEAGRTPRFPFPCASLCRFRSAPSPSTTE